MRNAHHMNVMMMRIAFDVVSSNATFAATHDMTYYNKQMILFKNTTALQTLFTHFDNKASIPHPRSLTWAPHLPNTHDDRTQAFAPKSKSMLVYFQMWLLVIAVLLANHSERPEERWTKKKNKSRKILKILFRASTFCRRSCVRSWSLVLVCTPNIRRQTNNKRQVEQQQASNWNSNIYHCRIRCRIASYEFPFRNTSFRLMRPNNRICRRRKEKNLYCWLWFNSVDVLASER